MSGIGAAQGVLPDHFLMHERHELAAWADDELRTKQVLWVLPVLLPRVLLVLWYEGLGLKRALCTHCSHGRAGAAPPHASQHVPVRPVVVSREERPSAGLTGATVVRAAEPAAVEQGNDCCW